MNDELENIRRLLEIEVNRHGYSLQYSVIALANALFNRHLSPWRAPVPEFPVEVQGHATRIDAILKHRDRSLFLVLEIKRANPALSNWCFLKAPFPNDSLASTVSAETINLYDPGRFLAKVEPLGARENVYHLAFEVKSSQKGDTVGGKRGAIEDAATQVLRGLNGIFEYLSTNPQFLKKFGSMTFFPVVVTTAKLFISPVDLSKSDLQTGEINLANEFLSETKWLVYNYPQSPGLKHSVPTKPRSDDFREAFGVDFLRSIAFVNTSALDDFFGSGLWI